MPRYWGGAVGEMVAGGKVGEEVVGGDSVGAEVEVHA